MGQLFGWMGQLWLEWDIFQIQQGYRFYHNNCHMVEWDRFYLVNYMQDDKNCIVLTTVWLPSNPQKLWDFHEILEDD